MSLFNQVLVEGNLVKDPEVKSIPGGKKVAQFPLGASQRFKFKGKDIKKVSFFLIESWRNPERIKEVLKKGDSVVIIGEMITDSYVDRNGAKKSISKLQVKDILKSIFLEGGQSESSSQNPPRQREPGDDDDFVSEEDYL